MAFEDWPAVTREQGKEEVGPGWASLLDPLFDFCEKHNVKVLQVKEKFGGLRFYTAEAQWEFPEGDSVGRPTELGKLIREAEEKADITCEWCGAPGRHRQGGWIKTLCDEHAEKWKKGERWW